MIEKSELSNLIRNHVYKEVIKDKSFIIAANWKMHKTVKETREFMDCFSKVEWSEKNKVLFFPPSPYAFLVSELLKHSKAQFGMQNMYYESSGAYTGEVSPSMLLDFNCSYVLVGHSERRTLFSETDEMIRKKVCAAIKYGISPVLCIGENSEERSRNLYKEVLFWQVRNAIGNINSDSARKVVVAYEPVWAIGTGVNATPDQVEETHNYIRSILRELFENSVASVIPILYGGSVKKSNVTEIAVADNVSGFLIGGASLNPDEFGGIVKLLDA